MLKSLATASAVVIATATVGIGTASADESSSARGVREKTAGIKWFGHTVHVKKHNRDKAVVRARYKCEGTGVHLWASVKQGPEVNRYQPTAERPSPPADLARSWYETPEGPVPFCDGRFHTLSYTISRVTEGTPSHPDAWKRLRNGKAWAQFVIFSVPEGADPATTEPHRDAFAGPVRVKKRH